MVKLAPTVFALMGIVLSSCSAAGSIAEPAATRSTDSGRVEAVVAAEARFLHHHESVTDMAENADAVVIGVVSAEQEGAVSADGDGQRDERAQYRNLTIDVTTTLAGTELDQFTLWTFGWGWVDGERQPQTFAGVPWLEVGDTVLLAVGPEESGGVRGADSSASTQVFVDGRIAPIPGSDDELSGQLESMTAEQVESAFADAA